MKFIDFLNESKDDAFNYQLLSRLNTIVNIF